MFSVSSTSWSPDSQLSLTFSYLCIHLVFITRSRSLGFDANEHVFEKLEPRTRRPMTTTMTSPWTVVFSVERQYHHCISSLSYRHQQNGADVFCSRLKAQDSSDDWRHWSFAVLSGCRATGVDADNPCYLPIPSESRDVTYGQPQKTRTRLPMT
ncbi:hypothetical protein GALMADRAFT_494795 [Galerina marginata CBS 339.88]|uniref:Uncharacterized protein n=1 Tax=Galerina marginata (strain CBS 339.88) TaxID=685588 RepID=A0A067T015_GALM3|nr:hypothetical protein GALMADRAFT_494795 [Galerina marginata CBS 339.88]